MPRQTKEERIRELEETNRKLMEGIEQLSRRNQELTEAEEGTFLHSPTYLQMQSELDFFKSLNKLNEINLEKQKKKTLLADAMVTQIYEDNRKLTSDNADASYFIGISENQHNAKEYMKLQEKIFGLEAKVEQQGDSIAIRNAEIERLQKQLAEVMAEQTKCEPVRRAADKQENPEDGGSISRPRRRAR